jgi:hypothetical protein
LNGSTCSSASSVFFSRKLSVRLRIKSGKLDNRPRSAIRRAASEKGSSLLLLSKARTTERKGDVGVKAYRTCRFHSSAVLALHARSAAGKSMSRSLSERSCGVFVDAACSRSVRKTMKATLPRPQTESASTSTQGREDGERTSATSPP